MSHYTVFRMDDGHICYLCRPADSLDEFMDVVGEFYADGWAGEPDLIAWAHERVGFTTCDKVCAESIAAGRTVDKVDGKFVARGNPIAEAPEAAEQAEIDAAKCQPAHVSHVEPSIADRLRDLLRVQAGECGEDDYMNGLYNGLELALATIEGRDPVYFTKQAKAPATVSTAKPALPALQKLADGHSPVFGSAALLR